MNIYGEEFTGYDLSCMVFAILTIGGFLILSAAGVLFFVEALYVP